VEEPATATDEPGADEDNANNKETDKVCKYLFRSGFSTAN